MDPISLAIQGVKAAIELARSLISALSASEEERQKHLAELHGILDQDKADVSAAAAKTKKALEDLDTSKPR